MPLRKCPDCGHTHICSDRFENYSRVRLVLYVNNIRTRELPKGTPHSEIAKWKKVIPNIEFRSEEIEQGTDKIISSRPYPPEKKDL